MALSTITLKWNLTDLVQGGQTATLVITPSAQMADSTDHVLVAQPVPRRVVFSGGQGQLAGIIANDNSSILPTGTGYTIEVVTSTGAVIVPAFTTQLLTANGATQWLDQLAPVSAVTTGYLFLPLPSGTPVAGQVPAVITNGSTATEWATGGGVGPSPTFTGTVTVAGQMIKVGPTTYSFTPVGSNSSYLLIDKAATAGDASLVLRDQGAIRGEVGLAADDNLHVKAATGAAGSETFADAILVLNSSANVEIVNQLGVGTVPSAQFHVASAAGTGGRTLAKLENTTGAGAGFDFVGDSPNVQWGLLTDIALNGGNNFGIFDLVAGYPPQVTVAGAGGGVSVGSDTVQPSAAHSLDVVGSVQTRGVHGLSPANFVGRGTVTGAPASGTFQTGDAMLDSAGTWFICTAGGTPGTWSVNAVAACQPQDLNELLTAPTGATGETIPRAIATATSGTMASGTVYARAIGLRSGVPVNGITLYNTASTEVTLADLTHGWYVLCDKNMVVRAVSADQTGVAFFNAFNTGYSLSVAASAYTTTYTGLYYVGVMVAISAGSMPGLAIGGNTSTGVAQASPVLYGSSSTGQTTPPVAGSSLSAVSFLTGFNFYAWTS